MQKESHWLILNPQKTHPYSAQYWESPPPTHPLGKSTSTTSTGAGREVAGTPSTDLGTASWLALGPNTAGGSSLDLGVCLFEGTLFGIGFKGN